MRNYFILNGVDSRDFGVYISGQGTYSAPQKAYTFYNIPGRNGAILGNENRLENINVSYDAFIYADFDNNIAKFRTFLLSLNGYQRLTDSYHPDEYRYAVYQGPFEPKVTKVNDAGSFTITFSCKPQRYLVSGDTVYNWTNQEFTGEELVLDGSKVDDSVLVWEYERHETYTDYSVNPRQSTIFYADSMDVNTRSGTSETTTTFALPNVTKAKYDLINGDITVYASIETFPSTGWQAENESQGIFKRTVSGWSKINAAFRKASWNDSVFDHGTYDIKETMDSPTSGLFYVCLSGNTLYIRDVGSNHSLDYFVSNIVPNIKIDRTLSTPRTISSSPTYSPNYPDGEFSLYGSHPGYETFTAAYHSSDSMSNPTQFPSAPLIRAYGNGSFVMDGITVTITNASSYTDIDCELMDCYEGTINRNNDVAFSTYNFPMLRPGDNTIEIPTGSGITTLMITPRWWRV